MTDYKLLIDGQLVAGDGDMAVINPATEEAFTRAPRASLAQLQQAVAAARRAQPAWSATVLSDRAGLLQQLAERLEARKADIARVLTREQGKILAEAIAEVEYSCAFIRFFAQQELPVTVVQDDDTARVEVHRKPLGVVAGITPWNFPLMIGAFKLAPAVLAGNTFILKPAPTTPLTALLLGEACADLFPPGVVNVITDDNDLGQALTTHPDIAKVSFTGSTATGKKIMSAAAAGLKRLTLELGGNDAAIVMPDVEPAQVAEALFNCAFMNCGQVCIALKRLYVHENVYDELVEALADIARTRRIGDGLEPDTDMGPLQNAQQYEKVQGYLEAARAGGNLAAGGEVPERPGYFIAPTIVRDISDGNRLVDEEPFGPILPVIKYRELDDAVRRANASPYGLGGSVWSADVDAARATASQLECGTAWVNQHVAFAPHIPFGGAKESGIGVEFAREGLLEFTGVQVLNIARAPVAQVQH